MRRRKPWLSVPFCVVAGAAGAFAAGVRANWTPSLPVGLYLVQPVRPDRPLTRGALVRACLPPEAAALARERGYLAPGSCPHGTRSVLKQAAALPGDSVAVDSGGIAVNGRHAAAPAQDRDSQGRPLAAVPHGIYAVAPGAVWLLSGHSTASYDARYFGPVPLAGIDATARPLLTWPPVTFQF